MSAPVIPGRVAYVNARLIDPASGLDAPGGVLVHDDRILRVGADLGAGADPEGAQVVDCAGHMLAPGLVDMRVRLGEPGEEHKEDIASASRAAAAGGVTTMVALPDSAPPLDDPAMLEFVARRAREVKLVKVYCYGAATRGNEGTEVTEIGLMQAAGALGFSDGRRAIDNPRVLTRLLKYGQAFDALLVQHPEDPQLAADGVMNAGELSTRLGLAGISPVAELVMVERDLTLLADTGGRLHFAHLSTAAALDRVRAAKAAGLAVTCDTAPFYFALNELAVSDYRTFAKLSPPLRAEADRQAVVAAIADGTIDAIASDHVPEDEDSKRLPFGQAAFGGVGLETLLPIALELFHNGHLNLIEALRPLTCGPADLLGLPAGRLAPDAPADLVLFDPDKPGQVDRARLHSKSKNTPFDDRLIQGRVLRTIVDGRTVFESSP